jgi:glycosyltransferase involved in cell wall biosynthesis
MKALFLYTELSGYFLSCLSELSQKNVEIQVIHWPVNSDAPFNLSFDRKISLKQKCSFSNYKELEKTCLAYNPDIIYMSGWIDKEYLKICAKLRRKNKIVVLGFDNQWNGTIKQYLGILASKIILRNKISHAWVPGIQQYIFARKLGFKSDKILLGLYSCNHGTFSNSFEENIIRKKKSYPRNFIYTGRLSEEKGIIELYEVFSQLTDYERNGWNLIIIGTGPLKDRIISTKSIDVRGFLQPNELLNVIAEAGCHIFPSKIEPWGVAAHEFCSAGLPLLMSNSAGSATVFLKESVNGFSLNAPCLSNLKEKIIKITHMEDAELIRFGENSYRLSFQITPEIWSQTFLNTLHD